MANNDDLLTEIQFRLPIKSLLQFKSASKPSKSLISNPQFSRRCNISGLFLLRCSLLPNLAYDFVPVNYKSTCTSPLSKVPIRPKYFPNVSQHVIKVNTSPRQSSMLSCLNPKLNFHFSGM